MIEGMPEEGHFIQHRRQQQRAPDISAYDWTESLRNRRMHRTTFTASASRKIPDNTIEVARVYRQPSVTRDPGIAYAWIM